MIIVKFQVEMRVAHSTEEVRNLADQAVDYFTSCVKCGKPIDLNREFYLFTVQCPLSSPFDRVLTCQNTVGLLICCLHLIPEFCLNILARCNLTAC